MVGDCIISRECVAVTPHKQTDVDKTLHEER